MGKRIAKASKVPFVIRFAPLAEKLFGCFVWLIEGHKSEGDAPTRKPSIAICRNTISVFLHMLAYLRSKQWKHSKIDECALKPSPCLVRVMPYMTEAHDYSANPVVKPF